MGSKFDGSRSDVASSGVRIATPRVQEVHPRIWIRFHVQTVDVGVAGGVASVAFLDEEAVVDGGAHAGFDGVGREVGAAVDVGSVAAFAAVAEFVEGDAFAAVVFLESPGVAQDVG